MNAARQIPPVVAKKYIFHLVEISQDYILLFAFHDDLLNA